jgi:enediyne biosynthesis protein E4
MAIQRDEQGRLPRRVKVFGTGFLVFQLLFALNNYGPQRVPGLNRVFEKPFVTATGIQSWVGAPADQFVDITEGSGFHTFVRAEYDNVLPRYAEVMGGGVAIADVDGDGWEDVFFTSMRSFKPGSPPAPPSTLFRNLGDGTFEDVTEAAGLTNIRGLPQGALFFDFDNDGQPDLYVAAYDGGQLFRNEAGVFRDITEEAGLSLEGRCGRMPCFGITAAAADYNRNGLLDLLIVNNVHWNSHDPAQIGPRQLFPAFFPAQRSFLFRNNGDGTFTDVTEQSGVTNEGGKGLGAVWADFDGDGWPDLYFANDLSKNTLYINNRDGTFREVAAAAGVDEIKSSMGVTVGDFDHSGRMDIAITNLKGSKVTLFRNLGDLQFEYATDSRGLARSGRASGWGIEFVDFDMDGHADLVTSGGPVWEEQATDVQDLLFRNISGQRFEDVSNRSGAVGAQVVSRGLAVADLDRDGWPDLVFASADGSPPRVLRNGAQQPHGWLQLWLEGTESNRDAVGARVEVVRSDGLRLVQEVRAGSSYQSTSTRALFFGLGFSGISEVTVRWPSGNVETLRDVPASEILLVREGSGWSRR